MKITCRNTRTIGKEDAINLAQHDGQKNEKEQQYKRFDPNIKWPDLEISTATVTQDHT